MAALANENAEVREVEVGLILATSIFALSFASLWSIVALDFAASYSNVLVTRFARSQDGFAGGRLCKDILRRLPMRQFSQFNTRNIDVCQTSGSSCCLGPVFSCFKLHVSCGCDFKVSLA